VTRLNNGWMKTAGFQHSTYPVKADMNNDYKQESIMYSQNSEAAFYPNIFHGYPSLGE